MSWMAYDTVTGRWTAVDVIARCAASLDERPITIRGRLLIEPGSDSERAFNDFVTYGTPFTSPWGAYSGNVDAPLGGPFAGARVAVGSVAGIDLGDNPELHMEVLDLTWLTIGGSAMPQGCDLRPC